jgi:hypothetical protein
MVPRTSYRGAVDGVRTYAMTSGHGTMSASSVCACFARHRASDRAVRTCPSAIDCSRWASVESMARMHERRSDCHCSVNARVPAAVRAPADARAGLRSGSDRTWSLLGSSGSMTVQSPKLDTTLARDELAFITTHLSLKPGPPSIRVSRQRAAPEEPCAVCCRWVVVMRGLSSACTQARCRIADPAWPPRRIPAKYYHVGLYPSRSIAAGPDDGVREVMPDGDKKSANQRVEVCDGFLRRGGVAASFRPVANPVKTR